MFACSLCNQLSTSIDDLCRHLVLFHQKQQNSSFMCYYCKRSVTSLHALKRHLSKHHSDGGLLEPVPNENVERPDVIDQPELERDIPNFAAFDDQVNVENDPDYSLNNFVHELYKDAQVYVAHLYASPDVSRRQADDVIGSTAQLIGNAVELLKKNVFQFISTFEELPENYADGIHKLESMFKVLSNPFEFMSSEHQRLRSLTAKGVYISPQKFEMGHVDSYEKNPLTNSIELVQKPVYGQFVELRNVLKTFLELPGIYSGIQDFLNNLNPQKVSNFAQGELWLEISSVFQRDGKLVLPLHLDFDGYEPNNALGSHHNEHSLDALYASIPCLPPQMQSSVDNMFLFALFESKYRNQFGNDIAFHKVIDELRYLEEEGIVITHEGEDIPVYFCCCLIKADNKGNNTILGFVESFRANYYCRICKLHRNVMEYQVMPVDRLRTLENYDNDVNVADPSQTGIHEECVWNRLPNYHCVLNSHCDVMHDIYEGMLKYDICNILFYLIDVRGYFSLDLLCERIEAFDYGSNELGNKPPTCNLTLNRLQSCTVNLYATEMLCLARYLGEMIGDLVPVNNGVWKFYLLVREILNILTMPHVEEGVPNYFQSLVQEHHELYVFYFGTLKPKHHFMLHYPALMKRNGPLISLSSLIGERCHRKGIIYAKVCHSSVNVALSVAIRYQLCLCERLLRQDDNLTKPSVTSKVSQVEIQSLPDYQAVADLLPFVCSDIVSVAKGIQIFGTCYSVNMVIVLGVGDLYPSFGKICKIIVNDNKSIYFVVKVLATVDYLSHICAFETAPTEHVTVVTNDSLHYFTPLWERKFLGRSVVSLRHGL